MNVARASPPTYAAAAKAPCPTPRLTPITLTPRPLSYVDSMPAVILAQLEEDQLCKQRENTLIMKFSSGRPKLWEIHAHIADTWNFDTQPAVGFLDLRHVTLHMGSAADTKRALACPSNKLHNSLFRLF